MTYTIEKGDLFEVSDKYYFAHCISADYALGAGIAVAFNKEFHLKPQLNRIGSHTYPDCILCGKVFNLVTKKYCYQKPRIESLRATLELMKKAALDMNLTDIAMPKIGCGLDRLSWPDVEKLICDVFSDTEINILVRYLEETK